MSTAATTPHQIQALTPGAHTDSNGVRVQFSEADLQGIAEAYDPAVHEAPYVIGHPTMDAPAYGWARRFVVQDGVLLAEGDQVDEALVGMVKRGAFKKVSLSLYGPTARNNPKPGTWYPRHVGFLGAMPPAIKGLKSVQFSEDEDGIHEFSDTYTSGAIVRMLRSMRDWMLAQFGQDTADRVLPSWELDNAAEAIAVERAQEAQEITDSEGLTPAFAEGSSSAGAGADDMSQKIAPEVQAQIDAANQRADEALRELQARRDADAQAETHARGQAAVAFAERLANRIPAEARDQVVAIYTQLATPDAEGAVLSFGEGDQATSAVQVLEQLLGNLPELVELGERATRQAVGHDDDTLGDEGLQFAEGDVDAERLDLHRRALKYQRDQKTRGREVDYLDAVNAVNRNA